MSENVGERRLFDERFVACQDELYGYIASLLPRRHDADDVFQETSLKLLQNRDRYDPSRPFPPWAFSIALNEARMFMRKNRGKGGMFSETMLTTIAEEQYRSARLIDESLGRLADCLKKIAAEKRHLLEQCYAGSRSIKAIAASRGMEAETLYKQLERIRRVLLDCMRTELTREDKRDD